MFHVCKITKWENMIRIDHIEKKSLVREITI